MKNKKIIYGVLGLLLLGLIVFLFVIKKEPSKDDDNGSKVEGLLKEVIKNNKKKVTDYKKFIGGEVLNENTHFIEYAFISNNKAYIFDPAKLKNEVLSYKMVYEIDNNINIVNIGIPYGADIYFYTNDDKKYVVRDTNTDNKPVDEYSMFEKATYDELKSYNESYTESRYKQKIDYDLICNLFYVKDNILYELVDEYYNYPEKRWVPFTINKIDGNYSGEKIISIYNDRILRTDKGFYEIVRYYDKEGNVKTTTLKIDLLSKYYDEVLTFTYEYVILKDYTLIPINDVMTNRKKKYQESFYIDRFEETLDSFIE